MVRVGTVEMIPVNNHHMPAVSVLMDVKMQMCPLFMGHCKRIPAPTSVTVIGFIRGQGDPPHMGTGIDPPDPSRIPAKSDIQ